MAKLQSVAITGASGFVGSALAARLAQRGVRVVPLVRSPAATGVLWDPASGEVDVDALGQVDAVVHLAGESIASGRWTQARKQRLRTSRIDVTAALCRTLAALPQPPASFVCASGVGYYGAFDAEPGQASPGLDEASPAGDDFLARLCVDWEAAAQPAIEAGIRVLHARFGVVLGQGGGALDKLLPLYRAGVGGRMGGGDQAVSWVALDDTVGALVHLLELDDGGGAFNVTAPQPVTNRGMTEAIAAAVKRPAWLPLPGFAARLALGEMASVTLLAGQHVLPRALEQSGYVFEHPELGAYMKQLLQR